MQMLNKLLIHCEMNCEIHNALWDAQVLIVIENSIFNTTTSSP